MSTTNDLDRHAILKMAEVRKDQILGQAVGSSKLMVAQEQFLEGLLKTQDGSHYKVFPDTCFAVCRDLDAEMGPGASRHLLHLVLVRAIERSIADGSLDGLTPRLVMHQLRQWQRILTSVESGADWLNMESDFFHKEYGLASLRLYAAAAQVIDPHCGLPRSTLLKSGVPGVVQGLKLLAETGGFSPMFQIHTHSRYLDEFTPEGWDECYRCCVDLYERFPRSRGMFGGSWFYDPQVRTVSPRLTYLQDVPLKGGAFAFFTSSTGDHVQNAIATSPSRRKLFDEGKYLPKSYTLVWAARSQKSAVASASFGQVVRGPE